MASNKLIGIYSLPSHFVVVFNCEFGGEEETEKMSLPAPLLKAKNDLNKRLHQDKCVVANLLGKLEEKTSVDRLYVVLGKSNDRNQNVFIKIKIFRLLTGLLGLASLYLIFGDGAELVCNAVGFLYPAYLSLVEATKNQLLFI